MSLGRRSYHRNSREAEPEWFTGGPSSQNETIELHGFDGPVREEKEVEAPSRHKHEEDEPAPRSRTGKTNNIHVFRIITK